MVRFLRICSPLDNPENFKRLLLRPLKNADPSGTEILRVSIVALLIDVCSPPTIRLLWRKYACVVLKRYVAPRRELLASILTMRQMQDEDGNPLVPLPPVEMTVVRVTLHPEARVSNLMWLCSHYTDGVNRSCTTVWKRFRVIALIAL